MKKTDVLSGIAILAFSFTLIFVIIPIWVPIYFEGSYGLGAQDLPLFASYVIAGLSAIFVITSIRRPASGKPSKMSAARWRFLLLLLVSLMAFQTLIETIGFLFAAPFAIAFYMLVMVERRPLPILLTAVGAPLAIWLFFWQLLRFPLP